MLTGVGCALWVRIPQSWLRKPTHFSNEVIFIFLFRKFLFIHKTPFMGRPLWGFWLRRMYFCHKILYHVTLRALLLNLIYCDNHYVKLKSSLSALEWICLAGEPLPSCYKVPTAKIDMLQRNSAEGAKKKIGDKSYSKVSVNGNLLVRHCLILTVKYLFMLVEFFNYR